MAADSPRMEGPRGTRLALPDGQELAAFGQHQDIHQDGTKPEQRILHLSCE